jgi:hypothetical protein
VAERPDLSINGGPAVNRGGVQTVKFCSETLDFSTDLNGKLTGGAHDEKLNGGIRRIDP